MEKSYKFFTNTACKYLPCHQGIATEDFNCMFCFCPLYLIENCEGNYTYTKNKIKDCSSCTKPHQAGQYEKIIEKLKQYQNKNR